MSRVSKISLGGQLAAVAVMLAAAVIAAPAVAQSAADQTCRAALGKNFSVSSGTPDRRCCLVAEEKDWYRENDVTSGRVYLRADALKVRPKGCSMAELAGLGKGVVPGSDPTEPDGTPRKKRPAYVQPQSLLYGDDEDDPKPFKDIYY